MPVRCEEVPMTAPHELLAQLGLGEAGIIGDKNVEAEVLELHETPELFSEYNSLLL